MDSFKILKKLQKEKSLIIALVTGEKRPQDLFGTQIAQDILPIFYEILENQKSVTNISLILRSNGGLLETPLPLVNLIREYCSKFTVFVPENAHSAATLIALGSDEIIMSPFGTLSPVDPQINIKSDIEDKKTKVSFSVEDIAGYYKLIDKLGITDEGKTKALEFIIQTIPPALLGQIERVRGLIQIIADKLIKTNNVDETQKQVIIKKLVEEIPSHLYRISRKEATELGLPISEETQEQHNFLREIMRLYKHELGEDEGELIIDIPKEQATIEKEYHRAFIETVDRTYSFKTKYVFYKNGKVDKSINEWGQIR